MANDSDMIEIANRLTLAESKLAEARATIERMTAKVSEDERAQLQVIDERDRAEDALGEAYSLITGNDCEWSNLFDYAEALKEIGFAVKDRISRARVIAAIESLKPNVAYTKGDVQTEVLDRVIEKVRGL